MSNDLPIVIVGGGAAGFFTAINLAETNRKLKIIIIERSDKLLAKVKISGGGRCNVSHACWDPAELITFYPRGNKELLGPFNKFCTGDTVGWFEDRGVPLKIEEDNRMFPKSNTSQTIIDLFLKKTNQLGIEIKTKTGLNGIKRKDGIWQLETTSGKIAARQVMMAAGSSPAIWKMMKSLGHKIIDPVPSLFTFNIRDGRIKNIPGVSVPYASVKIVGSALEANGPLLITHWGMSGPAILKLSAFGARLLHSDHYKFLIHINFTGKEEGDVEQQLDELFFDQPKKQIHNAPLFGIPKRLWQTLLRDFEGYCYRDLHPKNMKLLIEALCKAEFKVNGKSTFKEEFVTAGGVELSEVDFRTMESKVQSGLHFAGEVLNIDAVTGGFNFQAAWTTSWLAAKHMAK